MDLPRVCWGVIGYLGEMDLPRESWGVMDYLGEPVGCCVPTGHHWNVKDSVPHLMVDCHRRQDHRRQDDVPVPRPAQ